MRSTAEVERRTHGLAGVSWATISLLTVATLILVAVGGTESSATVELPGLPSSKAAPGYSADPIGASYIPLSPAFIAGELGTRLEGIPAGYELPTVDPGPAAAGPDFRAGGAAPVVAGAYVVAPHLSCVEGHQTEDPLSPPCVPEFRGFNGGSTYAGVTDSEVRVLVSLDLQDTASLRMPLNGHYFDLDRPAGPDEVQYMPWLRRLRILQTYFNQHYETYGRRVHLWATSVNLTGPSSARASARLADITVRPYAVLIVPGQNTVPADYADEFHRRGIVTFSMTGDTENESSFASHPGLAWGYRPAAREGAELFGSYICQKVVRQPVDISGNPGASGGPRRLGMLEIADQPQLTEFVDRVAQRIRACGGQLVDIEPYREPNGCNTQVEDEAGGGTGTDDTVALARLRAHGVTTIIWPSCLGVKMARIASTMGYLPEWVLWGSGGLDRNEFGSVESGLVGAWGGHAILVTPATFRPEIPKRICYRAMASVDPLTPRDDVTDQACDYYEGLRQLFTALQQAGPEPTPGSMTVGMRRLPVAPPDPQTPRCAYPEEDFTCVKDAEVEWWDPLGPAEPVPSFYGFRSGGCWRSMEFGRRYTAWSWPAGNVDAQESPGDPCNLYGSHGRL